VRHPGEKKPPTRVPGHRRVFSPARPHAAAEPPSCIAFKHYKGAARNTNVILTIETADTPRVEAARGRVRMKKLGENLRLRGRYAFGFMENAERPGKRWQLPASWVGPSTSCRPRFFFCRDGPLKPAAHSGHAALAGSSVHHAHPHRQRPGPRTTSRSPPGEWWRWERR